MKQLSVRVIGLSAMAAAAFFVTAPGAAQQVEPVDAGLASAPLFEGDTLRAIALLRAELESHPEDPALLINLGIAQAQIGNIRDARANFERALSHENSVELETLDGRETDSRRLARLALSMLERGQFRPARANASQMTLRD